MTEPEIARRCPSCGVSIREAALFCPQCGKALPHQKSGESQVHVASAATETISTDTAALDSPQVGAGKGTQSDSPEDSRNESQKQTQPLQKKEAVVPPVTPAATEAGRSSMRQAARGAVGAKIQRATTLARDVEGDVMHRARKVREISSVVLDEAGYDPSLRFVLVAAILFLLFLVILVLNKLIT